MARLKQAMYYKRIYDSKVQCFLCPHNCVISPEKTGVCRVRKNIDGELYSLNYEKVAAIAVDPIEKKPLNRFHPGSLILSAGTFGCNLKCSFCQNWTISHDDPEVLEIPPRELVRKAEILKDRGNIGIAYTYNEPSIWYEYVYETARNAHSKGLLNVLVTNGFISEEPLKELLPYIDAVNIDVKAFTEDFYKKICSAGLEHVKNNVAIAIKYCHVELTTLVIPGLNDSPEEMESLAKWVASLSPEIPLHLSRFFPNYKLQNIAPTPKETLFNAKSIAEKYLKYVYLGNIY